MDWKNNIKRILIPIVLFTALTFVHELGHFIGLIICKSKIVYLRVPIWFPTFSLTILTNEGSGLWSWGFGHEVIGSLDLFKALIYVLIIPLTFEIFFMKIINRKLKWLVPFSMLKTGDMNFVYHAFRTFVFLNFGLVI